MSIDVVAAGLIFTIIDPTKRGSVGKESRQRNELSRHKRRLIRRRTRRPWTERARAIARENAKCDRAGIEGKPAEQGDLAILDIDEDPVTFAADSASQFDLPAEPHFRGIHWEPHQSRVDLAWNWGSRETLMLERAVRQKIDRFQGCRIDSFTNAFAGGDYGILNRKRWVCLEEKPVWRSSVCRLAGIGHEAARNANQFGLCRDVSQEDRPVDRDLIQPLFPGEVADPVMRIGVLPLETRGC